MPDPTGRAGAGEGVSPVADAAVGLAAGSGALSGAGPGADSGADSIPDGSGSISAPGGPASETKRASGAKRSPGSRLAFDRWKAAALLALAFIAWQWVDTRRELNRVREDIAVRLQTAEVESRDGQRVARDAQETVRDLQARLSLLDARVTEQRGQQAALEQLYQELSRSRDESVLSEVEQTLSLASQQLQLAGNVQGSLIALESIDARLARSDRPQFIPLRRVIGREIERLKLLPTLDLAGLTLRIDQLLQSIDSLPLAADARQAPSAGGEGAPEGNWSRIGALVWGEIRQLVRIERRDGAEPPLLAPEQQYFLRENLKLRLLNARVALLQRNEASFRTDLRQASQWVQKYFDGRQKTVSVVLATLQELQTSALTVSVPTLAESLSVVRSYKVDSDRARR